MPSSLPVQSAGTKVNDRYVLRDRLGSTGSVYSAYDQHLDKDVALKLLDPLPGGDAHDWNEARRLEQLKSRYLIPIINADVDSVSDIRFIVTELMDRVDFETLGRDFGLTTLEAVRYLLQIAAGISRIHAAGMLHRDVKPANILLNGDEALVADLEYCADIPDDGRAGRTGSFCTLAPEAAPDDGFCSIATDIYSLGATAFYLFSGEYPVDHRLNVGEQRDRIYRGDIRELRDVAPHVPRALGAVIRKCIALDPADRYPTADAFANALAGASAGTRAWSKVDHVGHDQCFRGEAFRNQGVVEICSVRENDSIKILAARFESGRKLAGHRDILVASKLAPRNLQQIIRGLS